MAPLPYTWQPIEGKGVDIAIPLQNERGEWLSALRWSDTGEIFAGGNAATAKEALQHLLSLVDFAIAAGRPGGPPVPTPAPARQNPQTVQLRLL